jgi:CRP/FNR family transcriptional regulator, cyclic AMP receptor protein
MQPTVKKFKPGEILFREGTPSTSLFIIKKGAVSIRKKKLHRFVEVAKITAGQVLGELSFFDRLPRSATAVAIIETDALEITFDSLEKIYNEIPDYLKTIMATLAERLRKANEIVQQVTEGRDWEDPESLAQSVDSSISVPQSDKEKK